MAKHRNYVGIDIGHSKVRVVMTMQQDDGRFVVLGVGESDSDGLRKGHIYDLDALSSSITKGIEQAERMAGEPVEQAYISVSGGGIESVVSEGVIAVSRADGEIDDVDIERVLDAASATSIPNNYEILSNVPLAYSVDKQNNILDPVGMTGVRLEVATHIMFCAEQSVKQLISSVLHTGVDVLERIPSVVASSSCAVNSKQKELGCAVLDFGSSTITLAVYLEGILVHTVNFSIGCEYITNDIGIGLKISRDVSERLKVEYGTCYPDDVNPRDVIDLSAFDPQYKQIISRRELSEIIEARVVEILEEIKKELSECGYIGRLPAGLVLVGGGSKMPGMVDSVREVVGLPAQHGFPSDFLGLADKIDDPSYVCVAGLIINGSQRQSSSKSFALNPRDFFEGIKNWYKNISQGQK
jgi:cell division protein FtsA